MEAYFASRIKLGKLDYLAVVTRYPQFKDGIDEILINDGFSDLIVNVWTKLLTEWNEMKTKTGGVVWLH